MDWKKWLLSGIKQIGYLIGGAIITLLIDYLTASLNFKPTPGIIAWFWENGLYPVVVTAIALLKNWLQHK